MNNTKISGVYALFFENDDNKFYIGKSCDVYNRYRIHCSSLSKNKHHSASLQEAFNTYKELPTLFIIKTDTTEHLDEIEIYYIDRFDSFNNGYNHTGGGDGTGYGYEAASATLKEEDYLAIFFMLSRTNMRKIDIAEELQVPNTIVASISLGNTHQYLSSLYPEDYSIMLNKYGKHKTAFKYSKDIYLSVLKDLAYTREKCKDIAKKYNIEETIVSSISKGDSHLYMREEYPKEYQDMLDNKKNRKNLGGRIGNTYPPVMSPDGIIFDVGNNAKAFALSHGLHQGHFASLLVGKAKSHKGWTLASIG